LIGLDLELQDSEERLVDRSKLDCAIHTATPANNLQPWQAIRAGRRAIDPAVRLNQAGGQ